MSFLYKGFSTDGMLNIIARHKYTYMVNLDYCSKKGWQLTIMNDHHGNFDAFGTIPQVLMKAFHPYLPEAEAERARVSERFNIIQYARGPKFIGIDMAKSKDFTSVITRQITNNIGHVPRDRPLLKCKHGTILYGVNCLQCARERKRDK